MKTVAVVGAGMAGMAAAYELARTPGIAVTLFEASQRLGGTIETVTVPSSSEPSGQPFVIETGPDSWVSDRPAARALAIELGLEDQLIYSNDARRRNYLARFRAGNRGELIPMPDGMRMMVPTRWAPVLESPLFSEQARQAYLGEPERAEELKQYAARSDPDADESVSSFVRRHFGDEATETIAGPLLAGVFGGDIHKLSARAVLAPFVRMEREHGSLVTAVMQRAAQQQAEHGAAEPIFTTLRTGLSTLIERMAATLPRAGIRLGSPVIGLRPSQPKAPRTGWLLRVGSSHAQPEEHATGSHPPEKPAISHWPGSASGEQQQCDAVILATPAHITRELLASLDPEAASLLEMDTTSAIVVALAWEREAARNLRIPPGFGFLVTPGEALNTAPSLLAGTFMDQKFPARAPAGAVFLRGFFGGLAAPRMMDWPDAEIAEAARVQFSRMLGPLPSATHTIVRRWPRSLPQYAIGHPARMQALQARVNQLPGLRLVGNAYQGVGLPNLIDHGRSAARELAAQLSSLDRLSS